VGFVLESETVSVKRRLQSGCRIDEKERVNETQRVSFASWRSKISNGRRIKDSPQHQNAKRSADVINEMFLAEFHKENLGYRLISRRREFHVQQAVRVGIDRSVQPISLIIELDHGFVDRNVIRTGTIGGL
jgi:hypothetical protein